jgi:dihydroneopterin aldolase
MCVSDLGIIELEGMRFWAHHGCLEKERKDGNLFIVDFKGELDIAKASKSDNLEDTVNYGIVYDIVKQEMATPSNLLEHVAGRIVRAIAEQLPEFACFSVRVSKRMPPVDGPVAWSRVTLNYKR